MHDSNDPKAPSNWNIEKRQADRFSSFQSTVDRNVKLRHKNPHLSRDLTINRTHTSSRSMQNIASSDLDVKQLLFKYLTELSVAETSKHNDLLKSIYTIMINSFSPLFSTKPLPIYSRPFNTFRRCCALFDFLQYSFLAGKNAGSTHRHSSGMCHSVP